MVRQNEILQNKVLQLDQINKLHEKEMKNINKGHEQEMKNKLQEMLSPFFTPGQVKRLMNPMQKLTRWSSEDIAAAISLRSVSPKAYRYLRKNKKIPLPALSTLRKWVASFNLDEGILTDVLLIMKYKGENMTEFEKATVICFDEIHLSNQMAIERRQERVIGPHKKCQVVMARGLFKKWKQPVFYDFDQDLTKELLFKIIVQLYNSGYTVFGMTCDLGPSNQNLIKQLKSNIMENEDETYFEHPCDENVKIHVFVDAPHLMKLLRNHFLDSGLHVDGHFVTSAALERLLQINSGDLKIAFKLSRIHLDVKGTQRQNVKLATQIFSATNASAIEWCGSRGFMDNCPEWVATATLLKMYNDWFDIFNSVSKYGNNPGQNGYGVDLVQQNNILAKVTSTTKHMKVGNRQALLPFQKGILICNSSLRNLYYDLKKKFNSEMSYVITSRLNQDVVENLFSYIRSMGATNDRPTALDIRYRLRWYILGKHSTDFFTQGSNTIAHDSSMDETCLTSGIDFDSNVMSPTDDDVEGNIGSIANFQDDLPDDCESYTFNEENADCGKFVS